MKWEYVYTLINRADNLDGPSFSAEFEWILPIVCIEQDNQMYLDQQHNAYDHSIHIELSAMTGNQKELSA